MEDGQMFVARLHKSGPCYIHRHGPPWGNDPVCTIFMPGMRPPRVICALSLVALCSGVAGVSNSGHEPEMGSGEMFDAIAPRYDLINTFLSLGMHKWWRARMVAALDLKPGATRFRRFARRSAVLLITARRQEASCWVC